MKTVIITKDDVLTAIETEPVLVADYFLYLDSFGPNTPESCGVCVVGGTLRRAGLVNELRSQLGQQYTNSRLRYSFTDICQSVCDNACVSFVNAPRGNWLAALSVTWEYLNKHNSGASPEDLRWNIWEWAEENIPDEWEYELVVSQGGVA